MQTQSTAQVSAVDVFLDTYVCWREACEDVGNAYRCWADAWTEDRSLKFEIYRAALEREEQAAHVHELSAERLGCADRR